MSAVTAVVAAAAAALVITSPAADGSVAMET